MTPAKCCSVLSHLFGKPDKMHSMGKWLEGIIEFSGIAQIESQPQYTVLQLLTFANSLLGVPSAFCSEALNEVVVDIFLLYACKFLSEYKDRKIVLIPQMKVYRTKKKGRDYTSDAALYEFSGG